MHFYYAHICPLALNLETDLADCYADRFGGVWSGQCKVNEDCPIWKSGDEKKVGLKWLAGCATFRSTR